MKLTRIMGSIVFAGDLDPDPDAAIVALRRAGFEVTRMPTKFRSLLSHPEDDFLEASIDGTDDDKIVDATMNKIDAIVGRYGGDCWECGAIAPHHVPFDNLFDLRNPLN